MFTKAALSRSRLALVLASALAASVAGAWAAPPDAAAAGNSSPTVVAATNDLFFDGAAIAVLTRGPALRNGALKARSALDAAADLTVATDANPYVERGVTWDITKDVDHQRRLDIAAGDTATFTYTLSVTHEIGADGGWLVYGAIQVRNPNTFVVDGVEVSDAVDNGGTCTVDGNPTATVTVPAYNVPLDLSYSCTYPSAPSPSSGTNTATVSWPTIGSPSTSASGSAAFDFDGVEPAVGNGSVDVMDPNNPDGALLGSVTIDDPSPTTFSYSVPFSGDPAGTCTDHPNTASISIDQRPLDHADATATVCVGADLTVTKTAEPSITHTYTWDISQDVDQTSQTIAQGGTAGFDYTVKVTHDDGVGAWQTTGTIHVSNPNDWEAITADVTDTVDNGGLCTVTGGTDVSIPATGTVDLSYTCTYGSAPSPQDGTNTATASWDPASFATPDGSASGSAEVKFSTVSPTVVDGSVSVSDPLDSGSPHTVSYTDPSPTTFTYHHDFSGDPAGTCTSHPNTATFTTNTTATTGSDSRTVEVCVTKAAANLTVTKTAHATYTRTYTWGITMSVDPASQNIAAGDSASVSYAAALTHDAGTDSDWQVTGTITVTNPNDSGAITLTEVEDAVPGGSCSITSGDPHATIDALGHVTLDYACSFASDPGSGTNTATATWDAAAASTPNGTASGTAGFTFGAPTTTVDGSVTVTDTLGGTLGTVSSTDSSPTTFTDHQHFTGDQAGTCTSHPNTATFTTNTTGTTGSDSSAATVCAGADIAVAKAATTSFTRTDKWKITKSVAAPTTVTQAGGSTAAFAYTVGVTGDGYVDGAWVVSGKVTLTNPNDWQAVTVSLADSLPGCTLDRTSVTVPKSGSVDVGYTCPRSNGSSGTNTATATWDTTAFPTPHGSAAATAGFTFGTPTNELGKTVTVTDTFNGSTSTLGTVGYPSPGTFSYSRSVTVPASNCLTYPNTATIVETGQSANASVQVCGRAPIAAIGGFSFSGTEPASVGGTVATFIDPNTLTTAGEYSVSINWGDGSPASSGTVTGGNGSFSVSGSHTYSEEGAYTITVTITDLDNASNSAVVTDSASIADAALTASCATVANSVQAFNGRVANLIDANPIGTLSDFSATIDWGDSSSSGGMLSGSGPFTVSGSHAYSTTGFFTITTSIKDVGGSSTKTACKVLVFAFAPGGGSFVIGDKNSANGTPVTFWGAQWWKLNSLTGGDSPAAFKGFALNPPTPSCGTGWSTDPGNSAPPPPGPLPAFLAVIASSSTSKSGKQIFGDTPHIVVVQTNPGYSSNPGHEGTGTVVARLC